MSLRNIIALLALVPAMAWAQSQQIEPLSPPEADGGSTHSAHPTEFIVEPSLPTGHAGAGVFWDAPNALTMQVIMAQKPSGIAEEQWRKMMLDPVNASLYPIRLTQAMLDTLDASKLDIRYQYIMSSADQTRVHEGH